jgi:glycosyltransferase involved in cell wall biosynthesis
MLATLNACDICVQPDPSSPLNDVSTMNKIMEYMALKKPVVAFDLKETRVSGGDAALYATPNRVEDLADQILTLADDPSLREELGEKGRNRVEDVLQWKHSEKTLLEAYSAALER